MWDNAVCERMIGTLRRELLDRLPVINEHHLRRVLTEYLLHCNGARPHRTLGQLPPAQAHAWPPQIDLTQHQFHRKQVPGGLTHEYQMAASAHPMGERVAQQARTLLTNLDHRAEGPKFFLRDRDTKFSAVFDASVDRGRRTDHQDACRIVPRRVPSDGLIAPSMAPGLPSSNGPELTGLVGQPGR